MTRHRFGSWHFDADTGELCDGETTTRLEPQVAKLLNYFLDHQHQLTSRDELISAVWEGRTVSDDAINRCVSILRHILSPDDKSSYIETVVRRGYISHFAPAPDVATEVPPQPRRRWFIATVVMGLLGVIFLYFVTAEKADAPSQRQVTLPAAIPVLAVLPFSTKDMVGDSELFANGMHDDLLTQLAQLQSLRVISRTSVLGYRGTGLDIIKIGEELGADAILEGSIQRNGEQVRINAQLIDARNDEHLWAGQFDRQLLAANLFEVQTEIAQAITTALHATLTERDSSQPGFFPTQSMAAYRAFQQAMVVRDDVGVSDPAYIAALEKAVALDPTYVHAWAELAGSLSLENFEVQNDKSIKRIEDILEHIRSLAPESAEYFVAQTYYSYYILKDYKLALLLASHAQDLRPSDARVLELKGFIQRRLGDYDGRIESTRLARSLDPLNPVWTTTLVRNLIVAHRYEEARQEIANAGSQNFDLARLDGMLQMRKDQNPGLRAEALTAIEREYAALAPPRDRWDAYIAGRDFAAAAAWLNEATLAASFNVRYNWTGAALPPIDFYRLITYWFLQDRDLLEPLQVKLRAALDELRNADGGFISSNQYLELAFLTATEGDARETERLTRIWRRESIQDLAEYTLRRHFVCRALGMAAAVDAAVKCIRQSLLEPSLVMPFQEPYLPYYDAIRNQPEFIALLEELQSKRL